MKKGSRLAALLACAPLFCQREPTGAPRGEVQVLCHRRAAAAGAIADGDRDGIAEPSALQCGGPGTDAAAAWYVKDGGFPLRVREGDLIGIARPRGTGGELVSHGAVGHAGKPHPGGAHARILRQAPLHRYGGRGLQDLGGVSC